MTAISVDRLLALSLGLKYRQVVTLRRTYMFLTTLCVISIVFSTMYGKSNEIAARYIQILTTVCQFNNLKRFFHKNFSETPSTPK